MEEKPKFVMYLYFQKKLLEEKAKIDNTLCYGEVRGCVPYIRIPKKASRKIIKEMEQLGLIEIVNKKKIKIINCEECKKL